MRSSVTELSAARILFENRSDAGKKLAAELSGYANQSVVVLAIPNGGIPLAIEVAYALKASLDIIICRKLASPLNPEGGLGAVADDGTVILNEDVIDRDGLSRDQIEYEAQQVKATIRQRCLKYKENSPASRLRGKTAIIVDDGLASGITMTVAAESVKHRRPREIVIAVPVASRTGFDRASKAATVITCAVATMPRFYLADFYRNWRDISDDEAYHSLEQWRSRNSLDRRGFSF
jgi:putative phosphoribosyl transferase